MRYDDENDENDDNAQDADNAESDDSDTGSDDGDDSSNNAGDAGQDLSGQMADASPAEVEAHRGLLGGVIDQLQQNGVDVDALAQKAGLDTSDVDALTHDDLIQLAQYVQQHHPEVLQQVAQRFPMAQGLLGMLGGGSGDDSGDGGGGIGGLIGRFLHGGGQ